MLRKSRREALGLFGAATAASAAASLPTSAAPDSAAVARTVLAIRAASADLAGKVAHEMNIEGTPEHPAAVLASEAASSALEALGDRLLGAGVRSWADVVIRAELLRAHDGELLADEPLDRSGMLTRELLSSVLDVAAQIGVPPLNTAPAATSTPSAMHKAVANAEAAHENACKLGGYAGITDEQLDDINAAANTAYHAAAAAPLKSHADAAALLRLLRSKFVQFESFDPSIADLPAVDVKSLDDLDWYCFEKICRFLGASDAQVAGPAPYRAL